MLGEGAGEFGAGEGVGLGGGCQFPRSGLGEAAVIVHRGEDGEAVLQAGDVIVRAVTRRDVHLAGACFHRDEIRHETNKLDWLFSTHTTSRSAAELLLFLHSGMMVNKDSVRTATVKAGRTA